MEVEEAKEQEEASPPSPVPRLAPRRSSMATARRLSRASALGGGIPLQDLLATVPPAAEAAAGERLVKVATLCINAAVRQLEGAVYLDEGEEEAAREVGKALRGVAVEEEVLVRVAGRLGGGVEVGEGDGAGEARRAVLARTAAYKAEHKAWGALVKERRAEEARATAMAKEVARGRKRIGADHRFALPREEREQLERQPDGSEALEHLKGHRERMEQRAAVVATRAKRLRRKVEEEEEELEEVAREIIARADQAGGRLEALAPSDILAD